MVTWNPFRQSISNTLSQNQAEVITVLFAVAHSSTTNTSIQFMARTLAPFSNAIDRIGL